MECDKCGSTYKSNICETCEFWFDVSKIKTTKITNNLSIFCKSMGKIFKIRHIARTDEEANTYCERNSDVGVIVEDNNGLIYIADLYQIKVNSNILPD